MAIAVLLLIGICSLSYGNENHLPINGFVEARLGSRIHDDPYEERKNLEEIRLQLDGEKDFDNFTVKIVSDFIYDGISDNSSIDLETGNGYVDLRQANILFSPLGNIDVKVGRQILTWGTGDLLFVNDLFPKDWVALLIGRDSEYLKAPMDAIKISTFLSYMNIDVVYAPAFDSDRFVTGSRISFYDRMLNTRRGQQMPLLVEQPSDSFHDDEWAVRLYRQIDAYELGLYYYNGFWKSPAGFDISNNRAIFPSLTVYGASLRGPIASGIGNIELGYYDSEDETGFDPHIRNSELRFMLGYERELGNELTGGMQYYIEHMFDYENYFSTLPANAEKDDKYRRVITLRLTKRLFNQNLKLSLFNFYSTTDRDGYLRVSGNYKYSDGVMLEGGINYFYGEYQHTFFSQFKDNSNVYIAARYSF